MYVLSLNRIEENKLHAQRLGRLNIYNSNVVIKNISSFIPTLLPTCVSFHAV